MENEISNESVKSVAMSKAGVNRELLYTVMKEGLLATKSITTEDIMTGEIKCTEKPDHATRHKFMDSALRATGDIKPDVAVDNRKVEINVGTENIKELISLANDVREQIAALRASGRQTGEIIDI